MRNSEAVAGGFNGKLFDITNPKMPYICHGYPLSNRPHGWGIYLHMGARRTAADLAPRRAAL